MGIEWRKDSIKAIHEEQAAAAKAAAMVAQVQVAAKVFASAAIDIPDTQALEMPDMFPSWEDVLANGVELQKGRIISKDQTLYRVQNKVTPQAHQPPGGEGMLAVYRPIDQSHAGTLEDPDVYKRQLESRILSECSAMITDIGGTEINGKEENLALDPDSIPVRGAVNG